MIPDTPATSDWAALRGDKWRDQLAPMEATLAPVDAPLIRALQLDAPYRIADIGCGGGGTSLQLLQSAPHGSVVHGFDISPALIAVAHNRAPAGETAIAFRVADMTTAPAPEVRYDRLVSRFGIMFFDDAPAAFHNIAGWLVPVGIHRLTPAEVWREAAGGEGGGAEGEAHGGAETSAASEAGAAVGGDLQFAGAAGGEGGGDP